MTTVSTGILLSEPTCFVCLGRIISMLCYLLSYTQLAVGVRDLWSERAATNGFGFGSASVETCC